LFVCLAAVTLVTPVFATETWDPHLHGTDEGLAAGALPPPGVYFINNSYFAPTLHGYGAQFGTQSGHANNNVKLFAYVDVPVLMWVPGCKFLGADYAMAIAQPFDYTNLREGNSQVGYKTGGQWGTFNTLLVPYELSWKLPCDFYIKHGFGIMMNDGTSNPATADTLAGGPYDTFATSSNGYYSFDPNLGFSWLHNGWNASVEFHYFFNLKNHGTGYTSGEQLAVDYTLTKTIGKWTLGVGASEETQTTCDSKNGNDISDSKANTWTVGPIVGYNFGPCSVQFVYNFPVYSNNDVGGEWFDVRIVIPLWH